MTDDIKITILTATFNCERTLEQTISSVINQDYPNIEYVIVDGLSTDNTINIIKKYSQYGIKWISESDTGLYDALNKGVDLSTGDYIQILGSDDSLFNSNTISNMVANIEEDTDVLSATVIAVDERSCKSYICDNTHAKNKEKYSGGMIPHQGMMVRNSVLKKYKFDTRYKISADYKFFLQCYYNDNIKFKFINTPVAFYSNGGVSSDLDLCWRENNRLYYELNLPFYDSHTKSDRLWKKYLKYILMKMHCLLFLKKLKRRWKEKIMWKKHHCDNKICRWCGRL